MARVKFSKQTAYISLVYLHIKSNTFVLNKHFLKHTQVTGKILAGQCKNKT